MPRSRLRRVPSAGITFEGGVFRGMATKHISEVIKHLGVQKSFEAQYSDDRWKQRARDYRSSYGFCRSCRRKDVELHVHHVNYTKGVDLWDAEDDDLVVLCKSCHDLIHVAIRDFRKCASRCNASNIAAICLALKLMIQKHGDKGTLIRIANADEA